MKRIKHPNGERTYSTVSLSDSTRYVSVRLKRPDKATQKSLADKVYRNRLFAYLHKRMSDALSLNMTMDLHVPITVFGK